MLDAAGIVGAHASPKGLRHGFGILAAEATRNPRLVQKWLGHSSLETTTIYMDVVAKEEYNEGGADVGIKDEPINTVINQFGVKPLVFYRRDC